MGQRKPDRRKRIALAIFALTAVCAWCAIDEGESLDAPTVRGTSEQDSDNRTRDPDANSVSHPAGEDRSPWVLRERVAITLSGVVLVDGEAMAGVVVRIEDATNDRLAAPPSETETGGDGRFSFEEVVPIREYYRIVASGPELTPAWEYVLGDTSKDDITLGLSSCTSFAYGTIRDASGGPIENARVSLHAVSDHSVLTDADGRYRLCVPEGNAELRVTAERYGTWPFRIRTDGSERHDGTLMPDGAIEGVVVLSGDGSRVPSATVAVWSSEGQLVTETVTDGDGNFSVTALSPGPYTLRARAAQARYRQSHHAQVFPGATAEVVVPIDARSRVSGIVRDGQGLVVGGEISIRLNGTEQASGLTTTDRNGAFVIDDVPTGTCNLSVRHYQVVSPFSLHVGTEGLDGVRVEVERRSEVEVTVSQDGAPVHRARVHATSPGGSESAATNALGIASLRGLAAGQYRIRAEHRGAFAIAEGVRVEPRSLATVSLELSVGTAVEGVVTDTAGRPIDGARISLSGVHSSEDLSVSAITDAEGRFRGGPLRGPSAYRVSVSVSDVPLAIRGETPEIRVPEDGPPTPAHITIVVDPQDKTLEGIVVDQDDSPVSDARVSVFPEMRHTRAVGHVYTGRDGRFVLRELGPGPFRVVAVAPSGSEKEIDELSLPHAPLTLQLDEVGSIHGALEGFRRRPVVMAWTRLGYDWASLRYAAIDGDRFTFDGLAPGDYYVSSSSGDQAATIEATVRPDAATEVILRASSSRTVRGRHLDLVTQRPLPEAQCQAAPYIEGSRSPVVVPGAVRSDEEGSFVLRDVPRADLYAWCLRTEHSRGGVGRIPVDAPDEGFIVYGLDITGRPPLDTGSLGFVLDDERPFSRTVANIEPGGPAMRSGLMVGDVVIRVGPTGVTDIGNGTARVYLALLLTEAASVPLVVLRDGAPAELLFRLRR